MSDGLVHSTAARGALAGLQEVGDGTMGLATLIEMVPQGRGMGAKVCAIGPFDGVPNQAMPTNAQIY
jgi:hypothetical protein